VRARVCMYVYICRKGGMSCTDYIYDLVDSANDFSSYGVNFLLQRTNCLHCVKYSYNSVTLETVTVIMKCRSHVCVC
jgi:hypothetical protein